MLHINLIQTRSFRAQDTTQVGPLHSLKKTDQNRGKRDRTHTLARNKPAQDTTQIGPLHKLKKTEQKQRKKGHKGLNNNKPKPQLRFCKDRGKEILTYEDIVKPNRMTRSDIRMPTIIINRTSCNEKGLSVCTMRF